MQENTVSKRKPNRLKGFDYNSAGSYFITICSKNRENIFGDVERIFITNPDGDPSEQACPLKAIVALTKCGKTVQKYIESGKNAYQNMTVENYIIMPNHIHLIIFVKQDEKGTTRSNEAIARFVSTLKHLTNKEIGFSVFQRSYHDRIIRNEKEYDYIWDYIDSNPACWGKDCLNKYINASDIKSETKKYDE